MVNKNKKDLISHTGLAKELFLLRNLKITRNVMKCLYFHDNKMELDLYNYSLVVAAFKNYDLNKN